VAQRAGATPEVEEDGVVVEELPALVELVDVELDPLEPQPASSKRIVSTAAVEPVRSKVVSMRITSEC